jgi:hypothetical protein
MKLRFVTIAMIVITALIISTFAAINCAKTTAHDSIYVTLPSNLALEVSTEPAPALTPQREKFQPHFVATPSIPTFARPVRRAPIRRKGRVKH